MKKFGSRSILSAFFTFQFLFVPTGQAATQNNADPNASIRKAIHTDPLAELKKVQKINNDLAIKHFTDLIQKNPKETVNYARRGKAYSGNKDYEKAIKDYDQAILLDPKLAESYVGRAVVRLMEKNYDGCWEDVHKAESLNGKFWPSFMEALKSGSGRDK
jgi:tetratricopeptide (TPR) repeat protein